MESTQRWTAVAVGAGAPSASTVATGAGATTCGVAAAAVAGHRSVFGPAGTASGRTAGIAPATSARPVQQEDQVLGMTAATTYVRTDKFTGPASGPPV